MKKLFTFILSRLLHHANREGKNEYFYKIKNRLLLKYGSHLGYDVQFIEGKRCFTCNGSGIYHGYNEYSGKRFTDTCNRCCGDGWYKNHAWNILERVQFGKYVFHRPYQRVSKKPEIEVKIIEGYIDHDRSKYGKLSLHILFLIYENGYLKRYWKSAGLGWRVYWYYPKNIIPNLIHLIKKRGDSIPASRLKRKLFQKPEPKIEYQFVDDDLPF